jgi:pyridoxal phosphate enzyme (YggS family)
MLTEQQAATRLSEICGAIAQTAKVARRDPHDIHLIAVSKTHPAEAIAPFIAAGQRMFGENRVQEAQAKWPALIEAYPDIDLHLIGSLQSNKAEDAVALFSTIHSVDRASLITALAKAQDKIGRQPRCFLQVNIGDEPQKGGCAVTEVQSLLTTARAAGLNMIGLMAVPPADVEASPYFALLAKLARDNDMTALSMGMSADLEAAVMLGSTFVRVGSALLGARPAPTQAHT